MGQLPPGKFLSGPIGNYQVTPEILLNGTRVPCDSWSVDINAYSMASLLEANITTAAVQGYPILPAFGADMQNVRPYPFKIQCGFSKDGSSPPLVLESGYVDERLSDYGRSYKTFSGRGTASIFQEIQVGNQLNKAQAGSSIIAGFFKQQGIPLTIVQPSPTFAGSTSGDETDPVYNITMRDRTAWDEMQAIALADGYRLTVHGGKGIYAPIVTGSDPVLAYDWAGPGTNVGLIGLTVRHSPRKSHNIKVILRSSLPHAKSSVFATYGTASASSGETFNIFQSGLKRPEARARAQAIWLDLAKREFLSTFTIAPDANFIQTVSTYGANFSINLSGNIDQAEALVYNVRQVRLEYNGSGKGGGLPLTATVIAGNLNPIQNGAFLS